MIAAYSTGLRPIMSVRRPLIGVMSVWDKRYDVPTQAYCVGLALRSAAMVGRAIETICFSQYIRQSSVA
jgi:hypothetical protein